MIELQTTEGKTVKVTETEFFKATLRYLRTQSPDRAKVIAEELNLDGRPRPVGAMVMMLLKNPEEVRHYSDLIPLEKEEAGK